MTIPVAPDSGTQLISLRSRIAEVLLLDVRTLRGQSYHWASTSIPSAAAAGITPAFTGTAPDWNAAQLRIETWDDCYLPWLVAAGPFHFSRSMQADVGNFVVQNLSGNTLQRDVTVLLTRDAFEGALFVYRELDMVSKSVEFEFHGRLSVAGITESVAMFAAEQLFNPSDYEAPDHIYGETCPWVYASAACGDTSDNPCKNSYPTCRVPERFSGVLNTYTARMVPGSPNVSTRAVVRRRQV